MAFNEFDRKVSERLARKREDFKRKEADSRATTAAPPLAEVPKSVEIMPPAATVPAGSSVVLQMPAPIQGMSIDPKITVNVPSFDRPEPPLWRSIGREIIEAGKWMAIGASIWSLVAARIA